MKATVTLMGITLAAFVAYALTSQPSSASTNAGTRGTAPLPAPALVVLTALPFEEGQAITRTTILNPGAPEGKIFFLQSVRYNLVLHDVQILPSASFPDGVNMVVSSRQLEFDPPLPIEAGVDMVMLDWEQSTAHARVYGGLARHLPTRFVPDPDPDAAFIDGGELQQPLAAYTDTLGPEKAIIFSALGRSFRR